MYICLCIFIRVLPPNSSHPKSTPPLISGPLSPARFFLRPCICVSTTGCAALNRWLLQEAWQPQSTTGVLPAALEISLEAHGHFESIKADRKSGRAPSVIKFSSIRNRAWKCNYVLQNTQRRSSYLETLRDGWIDGWSNLLYAQGCTSRYIYIFLS